MFVNFYCNPYKRNTIKKHFSANVMITPRICTLVGNVHNMKSVLYDFLFSVKAAPHESNIK